MSGRAARTTSDPSLAEAIRLCLDSEQRFPARMGRSLQHALTRHGLHFFKHRKRIVCLSPFRPAKFPFGEAGTSAALEHIMKSVLEAEHCTRKILAAALLPAPAQPAPEAAGQPAPETVTHTPEETEILVKLASDLHFLLTAGHLLEFPDGRLDAAYPPHTGSEEKTGAPAAEVQSETPSSQRTQAETAAPEPQQPGAQPGETPAPVESAANPPAPQAP